MNIFLTGGSGFIGGHIIERLARSHELRGLARSASAAERVRTFGATPVPGALATLVPEMVGDCEIFIHAAAYVESWGTRSDYEAANVEGTRRALACARAAGVKRFIYIGTEAVFFEGKDLLGLDESASPPVRHRYLYCETKARAEHLVLAANAPGFTTLSLRPRLVWGPRDGTILPELLEAARSGTFAFLDGGRQRTSSTYVENLALAVEQALSLGRAGEAYFISDDVVRELGPFLRDLALAHGVSLPARSMPGWVARSLARFVEKTWTFLRPGSKPPLSAFSVDMLSRSITVSIDKARRELAYVPVFTLDEGLERMRRGEPDETR